MKIHAKRILDAAASGEPIPTPKSIAPFCGRHWVTVYEYLESDPVPAWLYAGIEKWHAENGPIKPKAVDALFSSYMSQAYNRIVKCSIPKTKFIAKKGRPKRYDPNDDDDGPRGGGIPKTKEDEKGDGDSGTGGSEGLGGADARPGKGSIAACRNELQRGKPSGHGGSGGVDPAARDQATSPVGGSSEEGNSERSKLNGSGGEDKCQEKHQSDGKMQRTYGSPSDTSSGETISALSSQSLHQSGLKNLTSSSPISPSRSQMEPQSVSTGCQSTSIRSAIQTSQKTQIQNLNSSIGSAVESLTGSETNSKPANEQDACAIFRRLARSKPEPRRELARLYADCAAAPWAADPDTGEYPTPAAMQKRLQRATGVKIRDRKLNLSTQRRNSAIIEIIGPPFAQHRRDSHDKGAGAYSLGARSNILNGLLKVPEIVSALENHPDVLGKLPSLPTIERLLADRYGPASRNDFRDHLERTIGFRAAYPGQVLLVDATGHPVRYETGDVRGKTKQWIFVCADVASAHVWASEFVTDSESAGWKPSGGITQIAQCDVMLGFLRSLGFYPEWLINDAISTLTEGLRDLHTKNHPAEKLSCGVLCWLGGGVKPYVRMAGRPQGGAHVEAAVRGVKSQLIELSSTAAIRKEFAGLGLKKVTDFRNRLEFTSRLHEAVAKLNDSTLTRRGCSLTRAEIFNLESARQHRANSRHVSNSLFECVDPQTGEVRDDGVPGWWRIAAASRVSQVTGGRVSARVNGQAWAADLVAPEKGFEFKPEGKTALIIPPGCVADSDPETFQVVLIDTDGRGVSYQTCTAQSAKVDEYFQDMRKPLIGSYKALPWTKQDEVNHQRNAAAKVWRRDVSALKQGTTDEPIVDERIED
jgi:hypothetical protein